MLLITLVVICASCALAEYRAYDVERADQLFEKYIVEHNKNYANKKEKEMRFKNFVDNLHRINSYNQKYRANTMGINLFTDMSKEEFQSTYLGCVDTVRANNGTQKKLPEKPTFKAPESFDWRDHGVVTPVKDQANCGSCWAFSTIANVESQYAMKYNVMTDLSEQQEVDCDHYNSGCGGGLMDSAIQNIIDMGGLMSETDYPYHAKDGALCLFEPNKVQVKVTGALDFTGADEESIKDILITNGPLTISLGGDVMQTYTGGVVMECTGVINHALLVVGYGTDAQTGVPYWLIKNSWSESFGENGYVRLIRNNPKCQFGQHLLLTSQVA